MNAKSLSSLPGIGKKTAERLIIEMRDKVDVIVQDAAPSVSGTERRSVTKEAIEALQALGYKPAEAEKMINTAEQGEAATSASQLIRQALQATVKA